MKKKAKRTIKGRISLMAAVSIVVIVIVNQALGAFQIQNVLKSSTGELIQAEAGNNADIIDGWLSNQAETMMAMRESLLYMDSIDHDFIMDYLQRQLNRNEEALMYYVCFAYDKSVLPADHSVIDLDPTTRSWWKQAVEKGGVIYTAPYVDFATGQMIVSIAAPLVIQGEQAVILADITIDKIVEIINDISSRNPDTTSFLLAEDGSVVTYPNPDYLPKEEGNTILTDVLSIRIDTEDVTEFTDYDGKVRYVAVATVNASGWKVGVTFREGTLSAKVQGYTLSNLWKAGVLMVIAIVLLYLVLSKLLKPVKNIVDALLHVSEGDLSIQMEESRQKDEIGTLQNTVKVLMDTLSEIIGDANRILGDIASYKLSTKDMKSYPGDFDRLSSSINSVKNILNALLAEVQQSAASVHNGSVQLASAADSLSQGSVTQADSIQSLSQDIDDMIERIRLSSDRCKQANTMLLQLNGDIRVGNLEMESLLAAVTEIETMSEDIQKVMGAIDDIASQTNILALNASVEAARAGAYGRGFAVVAEEIRNLAVNCADEANKTTTLLAGCIRSINAAKKHADTTFVQLKQVGENSAGMADTFLAVTRELEVQAKDSALIQDGLMHIADVVSSNTAAAEQTAAASEVLSNQAVGLTGMTRKFVV